MRAVHGHLDGGDFRSQRGHRAGHLSFDRGVARGGTWREACSPRSAAYCGNNYFWWLRVTPYWLALLAFMVEICSFADARLLSAYYVLLFPLLLVNGGQEKLVWRRWWQCLGLSLMLFAVVVLMVSRSRPLFPALTITEKLKTVRPQSKFLTRLWLSYTWIELIRQQRNYFRKLTCRRTSWSSAMPLPAALRNPGYGCHLARGGVERVLADDTPRPAKGAGHQLCVGGRFRADRRTNND